MYLSRRPSEESNYYTVGGPASVGSDKGSGHYETITFTYDMTDLEPAHRDLLKILLNSRIDTRPRQQDMERLEQTIRDWLVTRTAAKRNSYDEALKGVVLRPKPAARSQPTYGQALYKLSEAVGPNTKLQNRPSSAFANLQQTRDRLAKQLKQFFSLSKLSTSIQSSKITKSNTVTVIQKPRQHQRQVISEENHYQNLPDIRRMASNRPAQNMIKSTASINRTDSPDSFVPLSELSYTDGPAALGYDLVPPPVPVVPTMVATQSKSSVFARQMSNQSVSKPGSGSTSSLEEQQESKLNNNCADNHYEAVKLRKNSSKSYNLDYYNVI